MLQVIWFVLVCLLGVWTDGTVNQPQPRSGLVNQTQKYGKFGFELAGLRGFPPENELETRIIGGTVAWSHSWPWQVCLQLTSTAACGGAIIDPLWILSAAHCFRRYKKPSWWTVLAGKHDLDNPHEHSQQIVGVSKIFAHKEYDTLRKENDIALLKLQQPLVFNQFVRPIDLWTAPLPLGKCTITGWGATRENGPRVTRLQEVNVTLIDSDVCNEFYNGKIWPSMFCAGREGGGIDACQGDSGGPLSCYNGSRYELAGVVSWGVGCGRAKKPGVYTKVQQYAQWIYKIMNNQDSSANGSNPEDDICGKPRRSRCDRNQRLADLSVSKNGLVSVVNVSESCPFTWCWMVSLQYNGNHFCSGTLIHPRYVITPQHCNVRAQKDVAVLGIHDLRFSSSQIIPIDKVINMVQEQTFPPKTDVSLLRLAWPARLGRNVCTVCVPDEEEGDEGEELSNSWTCIVTGWGATKATAVDPNRLHHTRLTLVNQTACKAMWEDGLIKETHLCAHPAGATCCLGDAGAPLFCRNHGNYFLFGLVTWGSSQCGTNKPAIFSRISHLDDWIQKVLSSK